MLQDEAAAAIMQRPCDPLARDVTGRTFDVRAGSEHLPFGGTLEIAVELLVDGHPAQG